MKLNLYLLIFAFFIALIAWLLVEGYSEKLKTTVDHPRPTQTFGAWKPEGDLYTAKPQIGTGIKTSEKCLKFGDGSKICQ